MEAYQALTERRSLRQLDTRPISRQALHKLLYAACLAPAPHHTRPWRFVSLEIADTRDRLIAAMAAAWRRDLEGDGLPAENIDRLLARSRRQIESAPALVLACLVHEGLRDWPDERRQRAEWGMALHSVGCAMENIMVAAYNEGLASYWISAPSFCPDAVREALDLPHGFEAQALVAIGYPAPGVSPRPRPQPDMSTLVLTR